MLYLDFHLDEKIEQTPVPSPTERFTMIQKRSEMMVTLDLVVSLSVLLLTLCLNVMSNDTSKQFAIVVEVLRDGPSPKDEYSVRYAALAGSSAICCTTVSGAVAMCLAFILVGRPPAEFDVWCKDLDRLFARSPWPWRRFHYPHNWVQADSTGVPLL